MEVNMRLQQMIFAAFASTVLLIGCHDTPNVVASSEVTPIMNIQTQMNLDETIEPLSLTQDMTLMQHVKYIKEEIKHVVLQFTPIFFISSDEDRVPIITRHDLFKNRFYE